MRKIWKFIKENKLNIFIILVSVIIGSFLAIFRSNRRFESMKSEYGRSKRDEGYKDGYNKGYRDGHSNGYDKGYDEGYEMSSSYENGYRDGKEDGIRSGMNSMRSEIYKESTTKWYNQGIKDTINTLAGKAKLPSEKP